MRIVEPQLVARALLLVLAVSGCCHGNLLVADTYAGRLMEIRGDSPTCSLYDDRESIEYKLSSSDPRRVRPSSPEQFDALMRACHENDHHNGLRADGHGHGQGGGHANGHRQTGFIYPGTKWCGPGNTAQDYDDLGHHRAEDACCREHDHCPAVLESGQCVGDLCNNAIYTKSHCDCDARFRRCLLGIGSETANLIGSIFFNVVQVKCFKEKRPCYPEDVVDDSGRCRIRFHAQARYEEFTGHSAGPPGGLVSNLLSSFLQFRR